jgi:hypothetical protein
MTDNSSEEINIDTTSSSLASGLKELSSVLQSTREIIDNENSIKNENGDVIENLTLCLKNLLYFLKSSLGAMKKSGIEIDLPDEFVQECIEEAECNCEEEEEEEEEQTFVICVDDQIIGYTDTEEDALTAQADYVDNIIQSYHNNYYYRFEKSDDGTKVTYYGFNRNTLFRWEQILFSVSYERVHRL